METYQLKIGFLGPSREQTLKNFKSFITKNKELFTEISYKDGTATMEDGTIIFCMYRGIKARYEPDQLLLSGDNTAGIQMTLNDFIYTSTEQVPAEYLIQYDEIKKRKSTKK